MEINDEIAKPNMEMQEREFWDKCLDRLKKVVEDNPKTATREPVSQITRQHTLARQKTKE